MDTVTLVENQIDEGQALLDRLSDEGFVFRSASWVKPVEVDRWSLYIVTPVLDEMGKLEAYRQILAVNRSLMNDWITASNLTAVGEKNDVAQGLLEFLRRYAGWRTLAFSPPLLLGGSEIEGLYIYPPGKRLELPIYGLLFRGEPSASLHLSLEPHNPQSTLSIESVGHRNIYPAETGIDWVVATPGGAMLERNGNGQKLLTWNLHGNPIQSTANEVWSLAKLRLHGFHFLREPR